MIIVRNNDDDDDNDYQACAEECDLPNTDEGSNDGDCNNDYDN